MDLMEKVVALAKRRGFVFPTSEIYGGLANSYDYGPMGAELLRNIRNLWWKEFIQKRADMVGLDSQIILHPQTWVASGHVSNFSDALIDCKNCNYRVRADHLIEDWLKENSGKAKEILRNMTIGGTVLTKEEIENIVDKKEVEGLILEAISEIISIFEIKCPVCKKYEWTTARKFNLLFETGVGTVSGEKSKVYLRGETAQGIFTNFKQVLDSTRVQLPFGIGQIGKSFRNEITTGQFVFRTLEFEQAEIEYFFNPEESKWEDLMKDWKEAMHSFVTKTLGIKDENVRWRQHTDKERSHYSKDTYDLDYHFPFGWKELWGVAYRTDYDLKQHIEHSKQSLEYVDPQSGKKFIPHVIEPAVGVNRLFLMALSDAYAENDGKTVLKLDPKLSPYKAAVFPLLANKPELVEKAKGIYDDLKQNFMVAWDARGNIGKRYAAQDEIGTPWCITVDFETLEDNAVTVRDRDTGSQERVSIDKLLSFFQNKLQ